MENKAISSDNIKTLTTAIKQYVDSRPAPMSEEDIRALILRTTGMTEDEAWFVEHQYNETHCCYGKELNKLPVTYFPNCTYFCIPFTKGNLTEIPSLRLPEVTNLRAAFMSSDFSNSIIKVHDIYAPKVRITNDMFKNCQITKAPELLTDSNRSISINDASGMFEDCYNLLEANLKNISLSSLTYATNMFKNCSSLKTVPAFKLSNCKNMDNMFENCYSLERLDIEVSNTLESFSDVFKGSSGPLDNLKCLTIKYIGWTNVFTVWDFSKLRYWGNGSEDNRKSMTDTLIQYSHDRIKSGMPQATIKLHYSKNATGMQSTKVLTDEEIAAITAKGYTIVYC